MMDFLKEIKRIFHVKEDTELHKKSTETFSKYRVTAILGTGTFGQVYKVQDDTSATKSEYALKVIPQLKIGNKKQEIRELETLMKLKEKAQDHPNILKYIAAGYLQKWPSKIKIDVNLANSFTTPTPDTPVLVILTELCSSTLHQKLLEKKTQPSSDKNFQILMKCYAIQLASALECIHDQNILHRDLTPFNILLNGDYAKIADYGLSRFVSSDTQSVTTDNRRNPFMSPDLITQGYNMECDVYSLGVIFFAMFYPTYWEPERNAALEKLVEKIPEELRELVSGMMSPERTRRPKAKYICNKMKEICNIDDLR